MICFFSLFMYWIGNLMSIFGWHPLLVWVLVLFGCIELFIEIIAGEIGEGNI